MLKPDPTMQKEYQEAIQKYEKVGTSEECPCNEIISKDGRPVYYVPPHVVIRPERETTKYQIVFDASAKTENGVSLNDCWETGQALLPELVSILLSFREHRVW